MKLKIIKRNVNYQLQKKNLNNNWKKKKIFAKNSKLYNFYFNLDKIFLKI
jgi:hypothetical protein